MMSISSDHTRPLLPSTFPPQLFGFLPLDSISLKQTKQTKWAQKVWLPILVHASIKNGSKPSHSLES
jgi:hypothetical protein